MIEQEIQIRNRLRDKGVVIKFENEDDDGNGLFYEMLGATERDGKEVEFYARGDTRYNALRSLLTMVNAV